MSTVDADRPVRRIWAAVPSKGPVGSKRRLAGLLDESERKRLSMTMFGVVLGAVVELEGLDTVMVVSPSPDFGAWSDKARVIMVSDPPPPGDAGTESGLNAAVQAAQRFATREGADRLLIVPADLPLLTPADLTAMLKAGEDASVVIAPDRSRQGTNALLLTPPDAITPSFGQGSYFEHRRLAEAAGLSLAIVEQGGLLLDLDTPADVALLLQIGGDWRVVRLLQELGVERRLKAREEAQPRSTTI
jgi:2-phospho-L-lactate/phosphoenolpyruvate guanylyltransferase